MKNPIEIVRSFFADVHSIKHEIQYVGSKIHLLLERLRTPDGTYVLVLPPDGRILGQMHHIPKGMSMQVSFNSPLPVPKGSWIVAIGPATLIDVRVGNHSQVIYPGAYPAVITLDEAIPGQLIIAMLEAPK